MPKVFHARRFPIKYEKNAEGDILRDKEKKPVEKKQFFKTAKGELIVVPGNGFVVRDDRRNDVAMTKEDFVAKYKRHKLKSTQGLTTAFSEQWRRYIPRE